MTGLEIRDQGSEVMDQGSGIRDQVTELTEVTAELQVDEGAVAGIVREMIAPVMETIGKLLRQNAEAIEQIACAEQAMSRRLDELEKRIRLETPVSAAQEKYIAEAARRRAKELMEQRGFGDDRKSVTKLAGAMRRAVLVRCGVGSLREVPRYEYDTALRQIAMWNDLVAVRDAAKEARERADGLQTVS